MPSANATASSADGPPAGAASKPVATETTGTTAVAPAPSLARGNCYLGRVEWGKRDPTTGRRPRDRSPPGVVVDESRLVELRGVMLSKRRVHALSGVGPEVVDGNCCQAVSCSAIAAVSTRSPACTRR
jgi:hypothetical protein